MSKSTEVNYDNDVKVQYVNLHNLIIRVPWPVIKDLKYHIYIYSTSGEKHP